VVASAPRIASQNQNIGREAARIEIDDERVELLPLGALER
jgi:hypothetical protein